jgi:hypothetical protein
LVDVERLCFRDNKKEEELAEASARGDARGAWQMKVMLQKTQLDEAWRRERRNDRELAAVDAECAAQRERLVAEAASDQR